MYVHESTYNVRHTQLLSLTLYCGTVVYPIILASYISLLLHLTLTQLPRSGLPSLTYKEIINTCTDIV